MILMFLNLNGGMVGALSTALSAETESPDKLYKTAQGHIERLAYENAARDLMFILDSYPGYPGNDEVLFQLGNSFYELGYFYCADETYRILLRRFRSTARMADAILALQKCRYHLGDEQQSLKFYNALETNFGTFKGIAESRYYAGQTYFNSQKYNLAFNILRLIDSKSDIYHFALYTSALIHLKRNKMRDAIESLLDITELSTKTVEQIEIVDAARLTLGYVNFELSRFESVQRFVSRISPAFYDFASTLLLQAWTSYKMADFQACLTMLGRLTSGFKEHATIPEAHFLMGQCYLKLGYYPFAVNEFESLLQLIPEQAVVNHKVSQASMQLLADKQELAKLMETDEDNQAYLVATFAGSDAATGADKPNKYHAARETLIAKLADNKQQILAVKDRISSCRQLIEESETQKNWRAYAEYGRVRAMYLDNIVEKE